MDHQVIDIRPLHEKDLSEWLRLRRLLWDRTPQEEHQAEMVDIIEHVDTQQVFVAEHNGSLVGFLEVSVRPFVEDCDSDHVGYLEGWFVEDDYRNQGIGRELVASAENWAHEKGLTEMASDAEIGNETSLAAHRSLGYKETSRLVHLRKDIG